MANILLTGGAGYIGSHLVLSALAAGHQPVIYDNFSNSEKSIIKILENISSSEITCIEGDVKDKKHLLDTLKANHIDAVIHLAGLKSVEESVSNPELYYSENVEGTKSLIQAMDEAGVHQLIFSSSATVYGEPEYLPLDEAHRIAPVNPYADSKIKVEEYLEERAGEDADWKIVSLRYFNPVGSHPSGLIGDRPRALRANLMPMIARVATGEREFLEIYGNDYETPDGTCIRDYIHIQDLVEGHISALDSLPLMTAYTAVNLGTGEGCSVQDMVSAFEKISGKTIPVKISPRRDGDIESCYANCEKAKILFGWQANRGLDEMCESVWFWCRHLNGMGS